MKYCLIQGGVVVEGPISLPLNDANTSNLHLATQAELKEKGYYPANITEPPFNPLTHEKGEQQDTISDNDVSVTWAIDALPAEVVNANIIDKKNELVEAVKIEARDRIIAIIPEWKQSNLNARMNELNMKAGMNGETLTVGERAEVDAMVAVWMQAKAVRASSDLLESLIASMDAEQLTALNVGDDPHWV